MIGHRAALVLTLAVMAPRTSTGQEDERNGDASIRLDDFRLSGPPASALLGISAASVTRPNTPRALIASLVSATGSSGLVPNGYSLETAPYWLSSHPRLQLRDYYNASLGDRLRYFTAFSVATSRPSARSDSVRPDARVSIAMRTLLLNGKPSAALRETSDSMRAIQLSYIERYRDWEIVRSRAGRLSSQTQRLASQEELLSTLATRVTLGQDHLRDSALRTLARRDSLRTALAASEAANKEATILEKRLDVFDDLLAKLAEDFQEQDAEPDGLVLEFAAGTRALFEEGEWSRARNDGLGVWITPMYRMSEQHLEIIGVARYIARAVDFDDHDLFDVGARAGFDIGDASLSAEWVKRTVRESSGDNSSRWAALFDYPLPAKLHLVASFGSDFRREDGKRPVIATIGINLGLGAVMLVPGNRVPK
ncbi:MAG TPA: hypothetical protein VFT21_04645 [Gemmatimonadaceae bacterium]|nr:hypothetical protein [Gemmatimonadaceae bacterium]